MTDTPIGDQAAEAAIAATYPDRSAGHLTTAAGLGAEIELLLAPYTVSMEEWLRGIASKDEFPDQDPEAVTMGMLAQILLADTSGEVLAAMDLERAKQLCGDTPGGRSPVLEIRAARPLRSDYEDGAACYVIVSAFRLDTGEQLRFTTGARAVQAAIWKHVYMGWMPFKACLEIRRERTRAGFYPLNLVSGI